MDVDGCKIVNVCKPPPTRLQASDLPVFSHPCLYTGDFNFPHVDWGYGANNVDGECLAGWASIKALFFFMIHRILPVFILATGAVVLILILRLLVLTRKTPLTRQTCSREVFQVRTSTIFNHITKVCFAHDKHVR